MNSLAGSNEIAFDIVPSGYVSSVKNRVNVKELPKEKIQEVMKTADVFEQEVILQDLLIAGRKMETTEERNMIALAAELYVKSSEDTQRDFLMHVLEVKSIFKNFSSAMLANSIFHESIESMQKGSSGLTVEQLKKERASALTLEKYAK